MGILLNILCVLFLIIGFLGTFVPVLPGAPLAFIGLLLIYFSEYNDISLLMIIITGVVSIVVSIVDNILPVTMTKNAGGSKSATVGSTIGLIVGFFIGPLGIIIGPFCGALIGELIHTNNDWKLSLKSAWGAFCGFLLGTGLKMAAVVWFIILYCMSF